MKILSIILSILSVTSSFGQSGDYCGATKKLTISEIKNKFPYSRTETIKLVSFKYIYPAIQESDTAQVPVYEPEIPKTNGTVDLAKMFETKTLDDKLTGKIMDILVNYDNEDRSSEVAFCYDPRNGIVFLDKENKVIGFVEICFECSRYKFEPSTMTVTHFCTEKFNALKDVFKEIGISYGTVRTRD
jgi:hypothetical protein